MQPFSPKRPQTIIYHGVSVVDDYLWLENFNDPEVKRWNEEQNAFSRKYLDGLASRQNLAARLRDLYGSVSPDYLGLTEANGRLFGLKWQPPKQQPFLVVLKRETKVDGPISLSERTLLDPNSLDPSGQTTIDFFVPSLDGSLIAVSLSQGGTEDGTVHIFRTDSGKELEVDVVPRVTFPTGGGSVAWNRDSSGFFFTRYPHEGERDPKDRNFFQEVFFHRIGTSQKDDAYVIGKDFPRIAETRLETSRDGRYVLASVANGDGGEFAHYVLDAHERTWKQITHFENGIKQVSFDSDSKYLYMLSRNGTPRGKILRIPITGELKNAQEIIPERKDCSIERFDLTSSNLFISEITGGPSRLSVFDLDGRPRGQVPIEPLSSVEAVVPLFETGEILFRTQSLVSAPSWSIFDPKSGSVSKTTLFVKPPVDFSDCIVEQRFPISMDGTRVPISVIRKKDSRLDGSNPTILTGYGGYGISIKPYFSLRRRVWIELGGIVAIANLRGGGEYGEEWHEAGRLTKKQNVFDDFIACAKYLVDNKYTSSEKLAIEGGSNGGLLMGAAFTQHPELFRAVISHVGVYDMLRVELDDNGAFNVTEFGTVKDPDVFHALYNYSPYHKVREGTKYPAILLMTGDNDGRVNPAHSRKMLAKLQATNASEFPILLRTSSKSGHGIGTALDERIQEDADVFAFLVDQLGIDH